jgi:hypothetical protein
VRWYLRRLGRLNLISVLRNVNGTMSVVALSAIWLAMLSPAADASTVGPPTLPEGPTFLPSSSPPISAEEMAAQYAKQEGDSYEDALRRMLIQERMHGLAEELESVLGSRYAGLWLEPATGDVRVGLLSSFDRSTIEESLSRLGLAATNAIVVVKTSRADLEATQYTLERELKSLVASHAASIALSESTNQVVVTLSPRASAADWASVRKLRDAFRTGAYAVGPPLPPANPTPFSNSLATATPQSARLVVADVAVEAGPELHVSAESCGSHDCGLPLRAGVRITSESSSLTRTCSAGFVSWWWSGTQTYFFIMDAGHCIAGEPANAWNAFDQDHSGTKHWIGPHGSWRFGNCCGEPSWQNGQIVIDAAIIEMSYAGYWTNVLQAGPLWMHGWPSGTEWTLNNQAAPVEGEFGCRSGQTTAYTCGKVGSTNVLITYEGGTQVGNLYEVPGACANPGDSGGPFVDGGTALGILSGAGGCTTYYTQANFMTQWFGTTVWY